MTDEMQAALREWLKENLCIDVTRADAWGGCKDVYVGIRLRGDKDAFSYERIDIPSPEGDAR